MQNAWLLGSRLLHIITLPACLPVCPCMQYHWKSEVTFGPLNLELQTIVNHHVGTGTQAQVIWNSSLIPNH